MSKPIINADDCVACGSCVDQCPNGVLELNDVAVVSDEESCIACNICLESCPTGAITEIED